MADSATRFCDEPGGHLSSQLLASDAPLFILEDCQISGTFPTWLPASLRNLVLSKNSISGTLPESLFSNASASLQKLHLDKNAGISGTLPTTLSQLQTPNLTLSFDSTSISGTLPTELGLQPRLQTFSSWNISLSGTLPTELGGMRDVSFFSLPLSSVSGTIPSQIGQLQTLEHVYLFGNRLSGSLPTELGAMNLPGDDDDSCLLVFNQLLESFRIGGHTCDQSPLGHRCDEGDTNRFSCPLPPFGATRCGLNLTCTSTPPSMPPPPYAPPSPPQFAPPPPSPSPPSPAPQQSDSYLYVFTFLAVLAACGVCWARRWCCGTKSPPPPRFPEADLGPTSSTGGWELNDAAKLASASEYKMGDAQLGGFATPGDRA